MVSFRLCVFRLTHDSTVLFYCSELCLKIIFSFLMRRQDDVYKTLFIPKFWNFYVCHCRNPVNKLWWLMKWLPVLCTLVFTRMLTRINFRNKAWNILLWWVGLFFYSLFDDWLGGGEDYCIIKHFIKLQEVLHTNKTHKVLV